MASDIVFEVAEEARGGKLKRGTLKWPAKSLTSPAVSGAFGNGALPYGTYEAKRNKMLDKVGQTSYCDNIGGLQHCWMQPFEDANGRTELGIHPDGGTPGTEGCIGLTLANTVAWYEAFHGVPAGSATSVVVKKV